MKAIRVNTPLDLEICELALPEQLRDDEVLIHVKAAGICGTDVHIYHGTRPGTEYPKVIGHEFAGEVVKVGAKVTDIQAGDHVAVDPVLSCGSCYACSIGRHNICSTVQCLGVHVDGGFAEYSVQPQQNVYKFSKKLTWEELATAEPFSIAAEITWRAQITEDDTVLIFGSGSIGLATMQVAQKLGARCLIVDILAPRLELAKKMGADRVINSTQESVAEIVRQETQGTGPQVVIDAVGNPQILEQAVKLASPAGRVMVIGFTKNPSALCQFDITTKELEIRGSRLNAHKFPEVVQWFNNREVQPALLVTHTFPFTEAEQAMKLIEEHPDETCKVLLTFE
ncbi:alcohol dehydrogenase GroES domain protein [Candidatus Vecturithrix granuli]|uniref:Alcohol dehydrogenase GroES domain protein n=1 Tax=Vecturithrix granuli TaxID=1499967 RepID=A0A081C7Q9_VECG1|nr:alcohol dehydrogenase GroES domain protein [Candidatus Vecturithrix granuli]